MSKRGPWPLWVKLLLGFVLLQLGICGWAAVSTFGELAYAEFEPPTPRSPLELDQIDVPSLPALESLEDRGDYQFSEVRFTPSIKQRVPGDEMVVWLYLPPGEHADASLPVVFIAPAGSPSISGMDLDPVDRVEHLPYLQEGFAVIAYSLDGGSSVVDGTTAWIQEMAFEEAEGGLVNLRNAMAFAKTVPSIDPEQQFLAGHSSAATVALLGASHFPELRGVAAYNAAWEGCYTQPDILLKTISANLDGFQDFCQRSAPIAYLRHTKVPVFLFGAADDETTPLSGIRSYHQKLLDVGADATLKETNAGGHGQSMVYEGIPAGIAWMKDHLAQPPAAD